MRVSIRRSRLRLFCVQTMTTDRGWRRMTNDERLLLSSKRSEVIRHCLQANLRQAAATCRTRASRIGRFSTAASSASAMSAHHIHV